MRINELITTKSFLFSSLVLILAIGMVSCDTSNTTEKELAEDENITVATVKNGEITQQATDAELGNIVARAYNNIPSKDRDLEGAFFKNVSVQGSNGNYYIIGKGKGAQNNWVSVARKLAVSTEVASGMQGSNGSQTLLSGDVGFSDETHTCEGEPCNVCEFAKNADDEIIGCQACLQPNGQCNHTVTSGG